MSQEAFSRLLIRLGTDPAMAGAECERLRARLIYFFERKGCRIPAELGDETINRVARKIEEGEIVRDLFKFSSGVARLVLLEHWDDPRRVWEQLDEERLSSGPDEDCSDHRLECMKRCLQSLSPEEQNLMIKNCTLNKDGKADLAKAMILTINALRLKVFRIRAKLYECRGKCLRERWR